MKVIKWLDEHFEETFLVFFLVLISCITMLQIIARTFFAALSWPEEFCRYCWIWSVFISLPYTMRSTFSAMMALFTTVPAPMTVPCIIMESFTTAPLATVTPAPITEFFTSP